MYNQTLDCKVACEACGKLAPINEKKSTDKYTVYDTSRPCKCGGRYRIVMED